MLKYMLLLANSATACEKFARNGDGLKTLMGLLENHVNDGKEILDVVKRMMVGSKTAVRTELTAQLEEQGYIEAVMALLKEKNTPMPMKVAGVEVLKVRPLPLPLPLPQPQPLLRGPPPLKCLCLLAQEMLQDDDEGTADTVKAKLDTYAEVSTSVLSSWFDQCLSSVCARVCAVGGVSRHEVVL